MLNNDDVIWAFRYLFGRDPESADTIQAHSHFRDWFELRAGLLKTEEFRSVASSISVADRWVMAEVFDKSRKLWINLSDRYVSQACLFDNYEPHETGFVRKHLRAGDIFVDIGANIGWFTMLASTIVGTTGEIYSFEPRIDTFTNLRRSVAASGLEKIVRLYNAGVSDSAGKAFINSAIGTDNPGGSFVTSEVLSGHVDSNEIDLVTIDSLNLKNVAFIKIDVEGSEFPALRGAIDTIVESKPTIMTEINPVALRNISKISPDEYISWIIGLGYEVEIIDGERGGEKIDRFPSDWPRDILNVGAISIAK